MRVYYHNDADGRCSGAIAYHALSQDIIRDDLKADFIEVDFTDTIDVESIPYNEKIYILDYSFKPDIMKKVMKKTKDITWIDHHKTSAEYEYKDWIYSVVNLEKAACVLTWEHFYPDEAIPPAVELIQAWDIWNHGFSKYVEPFKEGLALYPHQPNDEIWKELFDINSTRWLDVIRKGVTCVRYRDMKNKEYVDSFAFEVVFEGHKALACGHYAYGLKTFGKRAKDYEMVIPFEYNGDKWIIGLFTTRDDIDCSELAKKFGGGGHKQAAGFTLSYMPAFLAASKNVPEKMSGHMPHSV